MYRAPLDIMKQITNARFHDPIYYKYWGVQHNGQDLEAQLVPLHAQCPGKVYAIQYAPDAGNYIVYYARIDGVLWILRYLHLDKIYASIGDYFGGEILALTGKSGYRKNKKGEMIFYNYHLHRDVSKERIGNWVDPQWFDDNILQLNFEIRMFNEAIEYNKKIARYFAGLPEGREPTVLKASVKYKDGAKLALLKKFGERDIRIRIGVDANEFLNSGAGEPVPMTPQNAEKIPRF